LEELEELNLSNMIVDVFSASVVEEVAWKSEKLRAKSEKAKDSSLAPSKIAAIL